MDHRPKQLAAQLAARLTAAAHAVSRTVRLIVVVGLLGLPVLLASALLWCVFGEEDVDVFSPGSSLAGRVGAQPSPDT